MLINFQLIWEIVTWGKVSVNFHIFSLLGTHNIHQDEGLIDIHLFDLMPISYMRLQGHTAKSFICMGIFVDWGNIVFPWILIMQIRLYLFFDWISSTETNCHHIQILKFLNYINSRNTYIKTIYTFLLLQYFRCFVVL